MNNKNTYTIENISTQKLIASEVKLANTFLTRFKGLLGSSPLSSQQGLLISPCQQIHTHFMGYPIEVVFLDKNFHVIDIMVEMKPWKISKFYKNAFYVLELQANKTEEININDRLMLSKND
jgi:uncharacterized membrane protein (UPF0127 family)